MGKPTASESGEFSGACAATPEEKAVLVADAIFGRGKLQRMYEEAKEYERLHPMTEEQKKEIAAIGGGCGIQVEELDWDAYQREQEKASGSTRETDAGAAHEGGATGRQDAGDRNA